ncbi:MAG: tetratricopeptide repeat protein [Byssovorax sp.]
MDPLSIIIAIVVALFFVYALYANKRAAPDGKPARRNSAPRRELHAKPAKKRRKAPLERDKTEAGESVPPAETLPKPGVGALGSGGDENASLKYFGQTVLYYEPSHGNQIAYFGTNGRSYLWYPGNNGVVVSQWRIEGEEYCSRDETDAYNPVTQESGGDWERRPLRGMFTTVVDSAADDVFGLATGRVPSRLPAHPRFKSIDKAKSGQSRAHSPEERSEVVASLYELGRELQAQSHLDGSRRALERALAIDFRVHGTEEHPAFALSLFSLGVVLKAQGDLEGARKALGRSHYILVKVHGTEEHPVVAAPLHWLGAVLAAQGDLGGARRALGRSHDLLVKVLGTEAHLEVAFSLHALADLLEAEGESAQAAEHHRGALKIEQELSGMRD